MTTSPTSEGITAWPEDLQASFRRSGLWRDRPLVDYITERARERPDAEALIDGDRRLTYSELLNRVESAAERLSELGLKPDDRVLVQLPNTWQFVVFTLACFRAGIVPVMALPAHREYELRHLIAHAEARAIVVPDSHRDFDHEAMAHVLAEEAPTLDFVIVSGDSCSTESVRLELLLAEGTPTGSLPQPNPNTVACFLLSGGTTGLPKLIARTHNDYACNVLECSRESHFDETTRCLIVMPAAHNFPLACPGLLGTFFAGGRVVMLASPEPSKTLAVIRSEGITDVAVVPAVAQRWIDFVSENPDLKPSSLRTLQVGGSRMPDELAARVRPVLGATLQQVFGMAEGLINMTRLDDPDEVIEHTQGRPVCEADEVLLLDENGEPVATGTPGSLFTRGPYTPRGYYLAEDHNRRSFRADGGWYGSGDVVTQRADGNLIVSGRDKDIINRGGEKISAEEIENFAYQNDHVTLAAAVSMPDASMGEKVCLFVTLKPDSTVELDDIVGLMREAGCARFKYPERLEVVDSLPLTKVGKIDKKSLRDVIAASLAREANAAR